MYVYMYVCVCVCVCVVCVCDCYSRPLYLTGSHSRAVTCDDHCLGLSLHGKKLLQCQKNHKYAHMHTHGQTYIHTTNYSSTFLSPPPHPLSLSLSPSFSCAAHQLLLEQGVEEEASEIYVKQEIPFSIDLVGSLLDDIRCNLVGQSETIGGQTHLCPELDVTKLDDITSCLTILRDYITSWSRDVTKNSHTLQEEVRRATEQLADVEMQLQETMKESEGVETSLLNQLQVRPPLPYTLYM